MAYEFRWNDWNIDHIAEHGVSPEEAEYVVSHARPPYPQELAGHKYVVKGQTASGDYFQVIYLIDASGSLFVIHARPLRDPEKRRFRRRRKP